MADALSQHMKMLLESGQHSDFKIRCGESVLQVHRAVICQSKVLSVAFSRNFKNKEGLTDEINLSANDPKAVEFMVDYFYSGSYEWVRAHHVASPDDDVPLLDANIYVIADQFIVDTLQDSARNKFENGLKAVWNSDVFIHTVNTMWASYEYRPLYGIIEQVIAKHLGELLSNTDAESLISRGLAEGLFSKNLLYQVLRDKNNQIRTKLDQFTLMKSQADMLKAQNDALKAVIKSCHNKVTTAQASIGGKDLRNNNKLYRYYRAMEEVEEELGGYS
ncbi:BTB/POZ domain protein [Aspergillus sclerotialis]|uniref:BTB/POZ domain protein n=1 Tax=Aspergillus sclerotialis TaxID=2070753 RepID=A0A3A3A0C3_9EURO|nr:BTB/POZ domain protein [Aspergillus sclerotialis]